MGVTYEEAGSKGGCRAVVRKEALVGVQSAGPQEVTKDAALVLRLRAGDESAMEQLYDRYSGIVYSVALRVLNDTGAAEDVLQEVFMQRSRNPGVVDSSRGSLGAWLSVIARNRAIDALRKRKPVIDFENVILSVECNLESEAGRKVSIEKARAALTKVPADQRKALELAFFQGLTHTEIAAKTGEPLGTIKTRIRAALTALRKAMTEK